MATLDTPVIVTPPVPPRGNPPAPPAPPGGPTNVTGGPSGTSGSGDATIDVTERMLAEARDAMLLLEYAVACACKQSSEIEEPQKVEVSETIMTAIKTFIALIRLEPPAGAKEFSREPGKVPVSAWVQFEIAYNALAKLVSQVTAETLRNTRHTNPDAPLLEKVRGTSPAIRFSRYLGTVTFLIVLATLTGEVWFLRYGVADEGQVDWQNTVCQIFEVILPFMYGGVGACAYLLRSAHRFIHERTFDMRRRPEYWNRILLGSVSGGSIILFISGDVATDSGDAFRLSTAALGFLAGYSTDFLFSTIERVVKVLLPKVDISTMRRAPDRGAEPEARQDVSLKELIDRFEKATSPETKALVQKLIKKLYKVDV